ncbi:MAG: ATP-binding cassette domain-containing protein [Peptoniphilaceae bacterium]|nr:ATP-binding cassette domain-containing protein [Peptoniphilaceae bacterium]
MTGQLFNAIGKISQLRSQVQGPHELLEKYNQKPSTVPKLSQACKKSLAISHGTKRFAEKELFHDFSVSFVAGKKYRLIGASGAGKSTLLKILYGAEPLNEGTVVIDNVLQSPYYGAENIAYISEKNYLFNKSLRFNITLGEDFPAEELESVADSCGIGSWTGKKRLDTMIANNGENVSAGEKQRIILARALIRKKNILLFEEVTSHLDPESAGKIEKRILKDPKLTVFFVKHGDVERENLFDGILEMAENGEWPLKENRTL